MKAIRFILACYVIIAFTFTLTGCNSTGDSQDDSSLLIPVIFDTDANNELDDQHALAYLLLNENTFRTIGVTVNATRNGGEIGEHVKEAKRVVHLCGLTGKSPVLSGANAGFPDIMVHLEEPEFDGWEAVDFIIEEVMKERDRTLVVLAVGKLTNVALALLKKPAIADRMRVVWLGSNYPEPGEYNQVNDTASMSYVLKTNVPFEMATVRYGKPSGTAAVMVTRQEILDRMPGLGPVITDPVTGRHGDSFTSFGDYSVNLFEHIEYFEEGQSRSLFDMAAVAIVKDPAWARAVEIPCPVLIDDRWVEQPENDRPIIVWEYFDKEKIMADFFSTLED